MVAKKTRREHDEALKEALRQVHDLAQGKKIDVARSDVELEVTDVGLLRRWLGLSQQTFAERLGVSVDTVQNWEQGRRQPRGPARALLELISRHPSLITRDTRTSSLQPQSPDTEPHPARRTAQAGGSDRGRHPVDVHVGHRIRQRRWMIGISQQQLAERVGIKFSQIQKYETGTNRVSSSRLWDIAAVLGVSVLFFFEGLSDSEERDPRGDILADKEALELVRAYYAVPEEQRRRLFNLARKLSDVA